MERLHDDARLAWPDHAKGLAMLLVVVCHTGEGVYKALALARPEGWWLFYKASYAFMVPVFFFVAGWLAVRGAERGASVRKQAAAALRGVLYPYLLWMTLQFVVAAASGGGNSPPPWRELPSAWAFGWAQFWFLHALLLTMAADLALRALGLSPLARVAMAALALYLLPVPEAPDALVQAIWNFRGSWIYFAAGGLVFAAGAQWAARRGELLLVAVAGFVMLVVLHLQGAGHGTPLRPAAAFCGIAGTMALMPLLRPSRAWAWLAMIGRHSLAVFCLHVLAAATLRTVLIRLGLRDPALHIALGSVIGVALPMAVALADERWRWHLFRAPVRARRRKAAVDDRGVGVT